MPFANAGFSGDGCKGRGSNAAPSPTTLSRLQLQSGGNEFQGSNFKAAIHLRRTEFLSKRWGAPHSVYGGWADHASLDDVQKALKDDAQDVFLRLKLHMRDVKESDVVIYFAKINSQKNQIVNDFAEYRNGELVIKR